MTPSMIRPAVYPRTGLARLTRVELRKSVDTRSGRWLLAATGLVALVATGLAMFLGKANDHTFGNSASFVQGLITILLPVIGILLVTSEWSQRTALQTFALVPRRSRIIGAKLLAGTVLALVISAVALVLALLATVGASHPEHGTWHLAGQIAFGSVLVQLLSLWMGMGFGLLLLSSPAAIVVNFLLPTVWTVLASNVHALRSVQPWLDSTKTSEYLFNGDLTAIHWAQIGVTTLTWVLALICAGVLRLRRHEIA